MYVTVSLESFSYFSNFNRFREARMSFIQGVRSLYQINPRGHWQAYTQRDLVLHRHNGKKSRFYKKIRSLGLLQIEDHSDFFRLVVSTENWHLQPRLAVDIDNLLGVLYTKHGKSGVLERYRILGNLEYVQDVDRANTIGAQVFATANNAIHEVLALYASEDQ